MSETHALPPSLNPLLAAALSKKGYDTLTPVQAAVADPALATRDMLVSSRTGSGKTVAYGLGMASALLTATRRHGADDDTPGEAAQPQAALPPAGKPLALIIAPTRELALQVQRELRWLYEAAGAIITSCVGGMDQRAERKHLERGVHVVVGTPGRLVDHLTRGALQLDALAVAVLDEADEMLDLGFREDLELILAATPESRRTLLFSATLPKGIVSLATRFQRNAARIEVATDVAGHVDIDHRAAMVRPNGIEKAVVNLLRATESPASLVFCNTRDAVRHMHATLNERGFAAVFLSGELGQHERNQALQALRDGRARVCIATDVAARGIDLPNLGLVIHADLPHDSEVLQHRSGRTGRAGRKGISVMLVPPARRGKALRLYAEGGISPEWVPLPTAEEIRALDQGRMLADESAFADLTDQDRELGAALMANRPAEEIAAALARIFRARFPEPEEIDPLPLEAMRPAGREKRGSAADGQAGGTPYCWFELNVGRQDRAEPKGILRMLTRTGGVERRHVGNIRIHDQFSHVEIAVEIAERFERRHANPAPDDIRVRRIEEPAAKPRRAFGDKPKGDAPAGRVRAPEGRDRAPEGKRDAPNAAPFKADRPKSDYSKSERPKPEYSKSERPKPEYSKSDAAHSDRFKPDRSTKERAAPAAPSQPDQRPKRRPESTTTAKHPKPFDKAGKPSFGKAPFGKPPFGKPPHKKSGKKPDRKG